LIQYRDLFEGACYTACDPSAASPGCAADQLCVQRGPDPGFGICKYTGSGAIGSACEVEDNTTSCTDDASCSALSHTCASSCSFFAQDTGCPANTACSLFWQCEPPSAGKDVALGEECGDGAEMAQGCASDGEAFRGICFKYDGTDDPFVCEKACLGDQGCADGEFCALRFTSGVGICLPNPVCGDGEKGEVNEICDDGNTMDGDGCSADCSTVDEGYLCSHATTLAPGTSAQGDTTTGVDGLFASCQAGESRATLYEVTPPARGRLRLHLTSDTAQVLSLRTTCTDPGSETACKGDFGVATDQELIVQITAATPPAITAMVSAMTILEEAPYTIEAEFTPEDCGDGIVAGREVCDDGDAMGNDGCSADCRAIEYNVYCTEAPVLSTSATNAGTLEDAPLLYPATCAADDGVAPHENRLFTFVAPAAGTLSLTLLDGTSFAVLSVRDGCDAPATAAELDCRPAFLDGMISRQLGAGESITAVVTSYFAGQDLGTFTLDATFTPQ
jgi:cysteine-rich repeat protein